MKTIFRLFSLGFLSVLLLACDNDETAKGRANVYITDAPIDDANVSRVVISVNSIEVKGNGKWKTLESFDAPVVIDLMSYQNGETYFLTDESIDAGSYSEVRLMLDIQEKTDSQVQNPGCFIEYNDGSKKPLFVPSGGQSGYKAKGEFEIPAGGVVNITLDFDIRKAVVESGNSGKFILKPTVRLVANDNAGMIQGTFDAEGNSNKIVVFAYNNGEFTMSETDEPTDEEVRFSNAVSSAVILDDSSFTLAFMSSGEYDLYFASFDENGNYIELLGSSQDVSVTAGAKIEIELALSLLD